MLEAEHSSKLSCIDKEEPQLQMIPNYSHGTLKKLMSVKIWALELLNYFIFIPLTDNRCYIALIEKSYTLQY